MIQDLQAALTEELRDLLSAEKQLTKALPKLAKEATDDELKQAFEDHLEETKDQIGRLEKAFAAMDLSPRSKTCEAMKGLVKEGSEIIEEKTGTSPLKDAMLIAAAQKVENYEIGSYGTVCEWADTLGLKEVGKLMKETLEEEKSADKKLSRIAKRINDEAMEEAVQ